jgi:hypothetical protein
VASGELDPGTGLVSQAGRYTAILRRVDDAIFYYYARRRYLEKA